MVDQERRRVREATAETYPARGARRPAEGVLTNPRTARKALFPGPFSVVGTGVDPVTSRFFRRPNPGRVGHG